MDFMRSTAGEASIVITHPPRQSQIFSQGYESIPVSGHLEQKTGPFSTTTNSQMMDTNGLSNHLEMKGVDECKVDSRTATSEVTGDSADSRVADTKSGKSGSSGKHHRKSHRKGGSSNKDSSKTPTKRKPSSIKKSKKRKKSHRTSTKRALEKKEWKDNTLPAHLRISSEPEAPVAFQGSKMEENPVFQENCRRASRTFNSSSVDDLVLMGQTPNEFQMLASSGYENETQEHAESDESPETAIMEQDESPSFLPSSTVLNHNSIIEF